MYRPGDRIGGRYRLLQEMGTGAMGTVWSARNEATDRDFALKLMLPDAARDPQRVARFFKEAKIAGRLRHRCIVEVYDLGQLDGGAPYLVMELLDGEPLDALLRRMGRIPAGTVVRLLRDLARGLDVAHRQGIVHRDLKPANIFLHQTLEGRTVPKILDFGVSKLLPSHSADAFDPHETTVGTILGSPAYMSPEQTAGDEIDARADIWALGVIAYRCLSGAFPFAGANFTALALAINTQAPEPLDERVPTLPADLCDVVARCLSRDRTLRYPTAAALADAFDDLLERHELPTMELSTIVGQGLPSDLMKTVAPSAAVRTVRPPGASSTRNVEATRPIVSSDSPSAARLSRSLLGSSTDVEPPPFEPATTVQDRDFEATAAAGSSVVALPARPPTTSSRRRLAISLGVVAALLGLGGAVALVGRAPWGGAGGAGDDPAAGAGVVGAKAKAGSVGEPSTGAASTLATAAGGSVTTPPVAPPANGSADKPVAKAIVANGKVATDPKPKAPTKPATKPKDPPHDGLTNPGF